MFSFEWNKKAFDMRPVLLLLFVYLFVCFMLFFVLFLFVLSRCVYKICAFNAKYMQPIIVNNKDLSDWTDWDHLAIP